MTSDPFLLAAGGIIAAASGLVVAKYNGQSARKTKLMELEFELHWDLIREATRVWDALSFENRASIDDAMIEKLNHDRLAIRGNIIVLAGQKKAVESWKNFHDAIDDVLSLREEGVWYTNQIPMRMVPILYRAHSALTEFQLQTRAALIRGPSSLATS